MAQEKLLTMQEAADRLGISRASIHQAIKEGRLAHVVVLNRIGLREKDLEKYQPRGYRGKRLKGQATEETSE